MSNPIEFEKLKPEKKSNVNEVWQLALCVLDQQPDLSCNALLKLLLERFPDKANKGQRTSIYERLRVWRIENIPPASTESKISSLTIFEEALHVVSQIKPN